MPKQTRWGHGRLMRTKKILVSLDVDDIEFHTKDGTDIQTAIRDALSTKQDLERDEIDYYDLRECWRVLHEGGHNCHIQTKCPVSIDCPRKERV